MNEKNEQKADVYKTSKTTWFLIGFMVLILGVIIFMMMRKKDNGLEAGGGIPQMMN
jgi:hypothetical protein